MDGKNKEKYITKENIIEFSLKQNVNLTDYEVDIIYDQIKNNIDNILKNPEDELLKIKDKLSNTTYLKIEELYMFYKNKYQDYL